MWKYVTGNEIIRGIVMEEQSDKTDLSGRYEPWQEEMAEQNTWIRKGVMGGKGKNVNKKKEFIMVVDRRREGRFGEDQA